MMDTFDSEKFLSELDVYQKRACLVVVLFLSYTNVV